LALCACTLAFGRLHDLRRSKFFLREQARATARARDTASGGTRARHAPAQCKLWEGCSSLLARNECTLCVLWQDFHRPRREAILKRTIRALLHERQLHGRANSSQQPTACRSLARRFRASCFVGSQVSGVGT